MNDGIYKISFSGPAGQGHGLVTLQKGKLNGGDTSFLFRGNYELSGDKFSAEVEVSKWNSSSQISIFGPLTNFNLKVEGFYKLGANSFNGSGSVVENNDLQIQVSAHRLGDLA